MKCAIGGLAVDLGLRLGWARFDPEGGLLDYGSKHVGRRRALEALARNWTLGLVPSGGWVIVEGDPHLARPFELAALDRGAIFRCVSAQDWRSEMLYARQQRSGREAKRAAIEAARAFIAIQNVSKPTSLRHDAAEAILLGAWWLRRADS